MQCHSVVGGNKRRVNVGGGNVVTVIYFWALFGFSSLAVIHVWAPCSPVLVSQCNSVVLWNNRGGTVDGDNVAEFAVDCWSFLALRHFGCCTCGRLARPYCYCTIIQCYSGTNGG